MSNNTAWRVFLAEENDSGSIPRVGTYFYEESDAQVYLAHLKKVSGNWDWRIERIFIVF